MNIDYIKNAFEKGCFGWQIYSVCVEYCLSYMINNCFYYFNSEMEFEINSKFN